MEAEHPYLRASMLAALGNVVPSHLLDRKLWGVDAGAGASSVVGATSDETPPIPLSRLRGV
jgi:hypothetical protein